MSFTLLILVYPFERGVSSFIIQHQYLTAGDVRNIDKALRQCETIIVFQPEDDAETAKFLGWRTSDHDKRDALRDVGKYDCAACGNISTSRCMLDYPVFISIPDDR